MTNFLISFNHEDFRDKTTVIKGTSIIFILLNHVPRNKNQFKWQKRKLHC